LFKLLNDGDNDVEGARKPLRVTLHLKLLATSNVLPRFLHFTPQGARAHRKNLSALRASFEA
jgi:hypothetical protein